MTAPPISTVVSKSIIMDIPLTLRIMFCPSLEKERLASRSSHTVSFSLIRDVFFVFLGISEENSLRKLHYNRKRRVRRGKRETRRFKRRWKREDK